MTETGRRARPAQTAALRRALRREVPSTVGILADPRDFTAMRRYRTFTFDDHTAYLRQSERLLNDLAGRHLHTTLALFDPDDYAEFCAETGLEPDSAATRSRYTADIAARGVTVPYTGAPLVDLLPHLVDAAVRHATWQYATLLLADLGDCAQCGHDTGRSAFDRASRVVHRILDLAGPGSHHLVCSVPAPDEQLLAVLHAEGDPGRTATTVDADTGAQFVTVLAAGLALEGPGGIVLRTVRPGLPDHLHGWRLTGGRVAPLTAGEVFSAYCTDAATGEPVPPEPGVEYCAGFPLPPDDPEAHHH
ncbi:hypothetical protein [Streptomyces sp. NPDC005805]|uniref:hypothetical protein n=1 Tax=Streptomyces sp. NPDC005805 TaxID=3157068 RepID=UPI0033F82328